jgi:hypothetical protein
VFLPVRSGEGPDSLQHVRDLPITPCEFISVTVRIVSTAGRMSSGCQVGQGHTDDRWHSRFSRIVRHIPRVVLLNGRTILQSISLLEKRLSESSSIFERGQRMDPAPKASRRLERELAPTQDLGQGDSANSDRVPGTDPSFNE